jgi:hypothetical protein
MHYQSSSVFDSKGVCIHEEVLELVAFGWIRRRTGMR